VAPAENEEELDDPGIVSRLFINDYVYKEQSFEDLFRVLKILLYARYYVNFYHYVIT
jgi:hypothetical protein